jgi:hypothetical protein
MTFAKVWANLDRNVPRLSKQRVRTKCNRPNGEEYEETYAVNEHEIFIVTSVCCSRKDVIRHGDVVDWVHTVSARVTASEYF